ncbi:MAG: acetate--CoA ligase [Dehalococcoidia bacterium]|jgi:acetyl-CoA synthetase|nr:acetate--CoA ligase [Dehalococcoidia bacterium]
MTQMIPPQVRGFMKRAEEDYEGFWEDAAVAAMEDIYWFKEWDTVLEWEYPTFRWYNGGLTNICYSCLDYKVEQGLGTKAAFIAEDGDSGVIRTVTYSQLLEMVKKHAAALRGLGVKKGDRVAIYMPMGIEAAVIMLACARIGAIHMAIFAGFSPNAVADRLALTGAEYVFAQDAGTRRGKPVPLKVMVDDAIELLENPKQVKTVVVFKSGLADVKMVAGRDITWDEFLAKAEGQSPDVVPMESNDVLFVMPTSGTTAKPKVTVQRHGGYQVYIYSMAKWIYNLNQDDVWFCTSDIGWIVGHSYNVYGPLLVGCTSILFSGTPDYPRPDMWWDLIERNKATGLWFSPTGIRGLRRLGIEHALKHDLSTVERVLCAGEVLNPAAWEWLQEEVFGGAVPVIDHMWQTETGGPIIGNAYGIAISPIKPGSASIAVPGVVADVVDVQDGHVCVPGEKGVLVIKKPFPGLTSTLWGDAERYKTDYWETKEGTKGMYYAGDSASKDEDGYIWFAGRADEVIKIAAHRIGTVEIESALVAHPAVVEAGVSGVPDELRGEVASAFVVLNKDYKPSDELKKELITHVRQSMGPIVVIGDIQFVNMLPKTKSGKIMRRVMKALLTGKEIGDLSTVEEGASIEEIREAASKMKKGA